MPVERRGLTCGHAEVTSGTECRLDKRPATEQLESVGTRRCMASSLCQTDTTASKNSHP